MHVERYAKNVVSRLVELQTSYLLTTQILILEEYMWCKNKTIARYLICFTCVFLCSCDYRSYQEILPEFFGENTNIQVFSESFEPQLAVSFHKSSVIHDSKVAFFNNTPKIGVDSNERLYIEGIKKIHVFDKEGSLIDTIGREGKGPGEFQVIHNFKLRNDKLYVYDANLSRVSIFDTDSFELVHEIDMPVINGLRGLGEFDILNDEYLVVGMPENRRSDGSAITERFMHYFLVDRRGRANESPIQISKITNNFKLTNERGITLPPVPFDRTTLFSLSASGKMYFVWTDKVAIKIFDSVGEFLNGIFHPFQNVAIEKDSEFPGFFRVMDIISDSRRILGDKLPKTHPAISQFFVDDSDLIWISTIVVDLDVYEWWVLDETGELITTFEWTRDEPIEVVKNGKMYTRQTDEETGLQQVVRYRIEWEEL